MTQEHILIIGPSWVGDLIMSQALFRAIKAARPDCLIDLLIPAYCEALAACMPEINETLTSPTSHGKLSLGARYRLGKSLRGRYTESIVLPGSWKSALIPWFAGIPKRTGWLGECRYGLLNDYRKLDKTKWPTMVQRYLALAYPPKHPPIKPAAFWPKLQVPDTLAKQVIVHYSPAKGAIVLCPGAAFGDSKKWPSDHYQAVAKYFIEKGRMVWLLGGPKDEPVLQAIQGDLDKKYCVIYGGQVSLDEKVALLEHAAAVVSNDSGLMHVAAALNVPVAVIYGATPHNYTPPLAHQAKMFYRTDLACRPCYKRNCRFTGQQKLQCLKGITPDSVIQTIESWLN